MSKCPRVMTKSYRVDSSVDMAKIRIIDTVRPIFQQELGRSRKLCCSCFWVTPGSDPFLETLGQLLDFFRLRWAASQLYLPVTWNISCHITITLLPSFNRSLLLPAFQSGICCHTSKYLVL